MTLIRAYGKGFVWGFLFGTVGIFLLALLSLMHPLLETIASPFLLPGKLLAGKLAGSSASNSMIAGLYLVTGSFYGLAGAIVQFTIRTLRNRQPVKGA